MGKKKDNKKDIRQFDAIVKKHKMSDEQGWAFSDYIHDLKASGVKGSAKKGDFTFRELDERARECLGQDIEDENVK